MFLEYLQSLQVSILSLLLTLNTYWVNIDYFFLVAVITFFVCSDTLEIVPIRNGLSVKKFTVFILDKLTIQFMKCKT